MGLKLLSIEKYRIKETSTSHSTVLQEKQSMTIANTILQRLDGESNLNFTIQLITASRPMQTTQIMKLMRLFTIPQNLQDICLIF